MMVPITGRWDYKPHFHLPPPFTQPVLAMCTANRHRCRFRRQVFLTCPIPFRQGSERGSTGLGFVWPTALIPTSTSPPTTGRTDQDYQSRAHRKPTALPRDQLLASDR